MAYLLVWFFIMSAGVCAWMDRPGEVDPVTEPPVTEPPAVYYPVYYGPPVDCNGATVRGMIGAGPDSLYIGLDIRI